MTMHCSARAVGHAGAGDTYQEAGSTTPARVPAIRAAHGLPKGYRRTPLPPLNARRRDNESSAHPLTRHILSFFLLYLSPCPPR